MDIVINTALQIVYLTAPLLLCGMFVRLCDKVWYKLAGRDVGGRLVFWTGVVGTPVHEFGHAIACIIFGHKITGMKILSFDPSEEKLGYVTHTYNRFNLYQRIGNFFIALAPILAGCAVMMGGFALIGGGFSAVYDGITPKSVSSSGMFVETAKGIGRVFSFLFSARAISSAGWWLFILIGLSVSLHMHLSPEDFDGCGAGFITLCIVLALLNFILGMAGTPYLELVNRALTVYNTFITIFLCLAMIFAVMQLVVAFCIFLIRLLFRRKEHA